MTNGHKAKSFKGVPVAIEKHADGSVTVCREIASEIYTNDAVPQYIRDYFKPSEAQVISFVQEKMDAAKDEMVAKLSKKLKEDMGL